MASPSRPVAEHRLDAGTRAEDSLSDLDLSSLFWATGARRSHDVGGWEHLQLSDEVSNEVRTAVCRLGDLNQRSLTFLGHPPQPGLNGLCVMRLGRGMATGA